MTARIGRFDSNVKGFVTPGAMPWSILVLGVFALSNRT